MKKKKEKGVVWGSRTLGWQTELLVLVGCLDGIVLAVKGEVLGVLPGRAELQLEVSTLGTFFRAMGMY